MPNPLVSVVIPTYNSEKTLEKCLSSLHRQEYSDLEIIVVDNHSTDKTKEIASQYASVFIKGPERSSQRNFGASLAKGEFLFFVDSDMELEPDVAGLCVNEALSNNAQAIVIPEASYGEGFWAKCKALERSCYIQDSLIEAPRFFKKEAFFKVQGYDEELIAAEDWDLSLRLKNEGVIFSRINSFIRHNEGHLSLRQVWMKKFRYGKNIAKYIKKHKEEAKRQFVLLRPAFLKNFPRLYRNPALLSGIIIMKSGEFAAGFLGMLADRPKK